MEEIREFLQAVTRNLNSEPGGANVNEPENSMNRRLKKRKLPSSLPSFLKKTSSPPAAKKPRYYLGTRTLYVCLGVMLTTKVKFQFPEVS